jgi:hyperpolarization activated cyclic nucleotide-gated potassium channel 2
MHPSGNIRMFVAVGYFMEVTLSSVGYGDMYPITAMEKIYGIFLMLMGSVVFVRLLDNFKDMLEELNPPSEVEM